MEEQIIKDVYTQYIIDNKEEGKDNNIDKDYIKQLFETNIVLFLEKYGECLNLHQLEYIESIYVVDDDGSDSSCKYSVEHHLYRLYQKQTSKDNRDRIDNNRFNYQETKNKRYDYMVDKLIGTDYFSMEKCIDRHPFIYYHMISKYNHDYDDEQDESDRREPFKSSATLSERLLDNYHLEQLSIKRIETEFQEIQDITSKLGTLTRKNNDIFNDNQPYPLLYKWLQINNKQQLLSIIKEMYKRKSTLNQLKQQLENKKKRDRNDQDEEMEEDEEEEEEEEKEETKVENNDNGQKDDQSMVVVQEEDNDEIDAFIDLMKDLFINGQDKDFDYSLIDKQRVGMDDDKESQEDLLSLNRYGDPQPTKMATSRVYSLGENDDYDYEEEYRQSLLNK
ncbi:hypothetical protein DFA_04517 [Cavenderia fasciculata]|uniref:CCD97-like C-terminal domain-containing protein n=1 Tax=Cavenderia fasciculata TaxID=261658 RepID=F4PPT5_CACFS|nr:uncharacterized protein DFA_04517 [Cavenderia fasciculata]EGG22398.1 hypothetical protein DFA_04517 [Cavenderia fasciculata]|eukprot:XP_004360249.1 hypothetical protein DFA_04517 [Cavenderia fasciculata]